MRSIGSDSFRDRWKVEEVVLSEGVEEIKWEAFRSCSLCRIDLPESLRKIEGQSFQGCSNLKKIVVPESCSSVDLCAFNKCRSLKEIWIKGLNTSIEDGWRGFGFLWFGYKDICSF